MISATVQMSDARAGPSGSTPDLKAATVKPVQPVAAAAQPANSAAQAETRQVIVDLPKIEGGKLHLSVDDTTGRVVGRVVDQQTGALIWQVPSDDMLRLIAATEELLGPLYSTEA